MKNNIYDNNHISSNDVMYIEKQLDYIFTCKPTTKYTCKPANKDELQHIITERINKYGYGCDLNDIDVSLITDMESLFEDSYFYGDISKWDVSHVTNMANMFTNTSFNGDISSWDVSNITIMVKMFKDSVFNQNISNWDVSNVVNYEHIFDGCPIENKVNMQPTFNN